MQSVIKKAASDLMYQGVAIEYLSKQLDQEADFCATEVDNATKLRGLSVLLENHFERLYSIFEALDSAQRDMPHDLGANAV